MKPVIDALQSARLFLTDNLGLKLGALAIAVLMFSLVHGAEEVERTMYVDVVVEPPPDAEDMMLVSEIPDRVRLRVKGSQSRLRALRQEDLPPVEIRQKTAKEPLYYFEEEQFDLPTGIEVTQVTPSSIGFKWAPRAVRSLPVEVSLTGVLPEGLEWGGAPEVLPATVRIEGPRPIVNAIRTVRTTEIDVSKLGVGVVQRDLPLVGPPTGTKFDAQSTLVTLRVQQKMSERALPALTIGAEGGSVRSLRPRAVTARVRGPQGVVETLDPSTVRAVVDVAGAPARKGPVVVPVALQGLPDGVEVLELNPAQVTAQL